MKTNIRTYIFYHYFAQIFLEREMSQTKFAVKIKIHILCSVAFIFANRATYEMWKSTVEPGRSQVTCWIRKATNRHSEYVIPLLHCNNGRTNAPQCYVIRTAPVLVYIKCTILLHRGFFKNINSLKISHPKLLFKDPVRTAQ